MYIHVVRMWGCNIYATRKPAFQPYPIAFNGFVADRGFFFFFFHHACESRLNSSTTISASFFFPIPFNIWTRRSIIDVYILLLLLFGTMVVHLEVICVFRCSPTLIKGLGRPTVKRVLIASVPYYLQLEILDLCKST